jgi:hypothetical protein
MIFAIRGSLGERETTQMKLDPASLEVFASVAIEAEWRSILYALTVPEYMEAWFQMPDVERVECRQEPSSQTCFRIDVFAAGTRQQSIYGSCIRSKPDEITYLWERTRAGRIAESIVKLRLKAGQRKCTLHLKHQGLTNQQERDWYSRMWRSSLDRLCGLMQGTPSLGTRAGEI